MANIKLNLICSDNLRTRPIIDGRVKADGIDWTITVAHPSEMFWRQLHFAEFDISEMSMSSLLITKANGDERFVGIPVFTTRRFFHTGILVRKDAGINKPSDLKGKRVGVPEYQQTAALWTRAALQHVYDVKPTDMEWWMERTEERSHGGATGFTPPKGLKFNRVPAEKNLGAMMVNNELDACAHYIVDANLVDRSQIDLTKEPSIKHLFDDQQAEGVSYFRQTGFYPINHGMVVKRSVFEENPWVAINVFNAFRKAKELQDQQTRQFVEPYMDLGYVPAEARKGFFSDPFAYGVKSNRKILESIAQFSNEQGLTPRVVGLEELFAPSTMDL